MTTIINKDDELPKLIEESANLFAKFVIPLYINKFGRPFLYGSGFFIRSGLDYFLASTAHVLTVLKTEGLFYYISNDLTCNLSGKLLLTSQEHNSQLDKADIGILKLSTMHINRPTAM